MNRSRIIISAIFIISLSLRLVLSLLNRQANDDHLEVINWIVDKHEIPTVENCSEGFQPKIYYLINAGAISLLGIEKRDNRIVCAQLINFIFSFFILLFLWLLVNRQNTSYNIKLLSFALIAFNPCLVGINVQVTNDTLVILAGVLSIYYADLFFREKKMRAGGWMILFTILAAVTKGTGLFIMFALVTVFLLKLIACNRETRKIFFRVLIFLLLGYSLIVPFAGGYYNTYKQHQTIFVNQHPNKDPHPLFFKQTYPARPGITSIVHGYFTFRYFDMIRTPYITNADKHYPLHRTSLWSQLYGRTFFMHFDQWPVSWVTQNPSIIATGRLLIILGIFPFIFFITGLLKTTFSFFQKKAKDWPHYFAKTHDWIFLVFILWFLAFIVKYTYDYRDFSTMKSIFLFPVLPAFVKFFIDGFALINSKTLNKLLLFVVAVLVLASIYDIAFLILQLAG